MDLSTGEGKLRAVNFLLPYVQKIPTASCDPNGPRESRSSFAWMNPCCARR